MRALQGTAAFDKCVCVLGGGLEAEGIRQILSLAFAKAVTGGWRRWVGNKFGRLRLGGAG